MQHVGHVARLAGDVFVQEMHRARVGNVQPRQNVKEGGFPAAALAQKGHDFSPVHGKIHLVQHDFFAKAAANAFAL